MRDPVGAHGEQLAGSTTRAVPSEAAASTTKRSMNIYTIINRSRANYPNPKPHGDSTTADQV